MPSLFISHSSRDDDLVAALVDLLRKALRLSSRQIRCTSLDGFRLPGGSEFTHQLRDEAITADTFVVVITPASLDSAFVLFELGARWGAKKALIPLVVPAVNRSELPAPLSSVNALDCGSESSLFQFVDELANNLNVDAEPPEAIVEAINNVVSKSTESIEQPSRELLSQPSICGTWVGWTSGGEGRYSLMIEQYRQDSEGVSVIGRSYKPEFKLKADWHSTSASFNGIDGCLYVTYSTTIKKSTGEEIETRGAGRLQVHGAEITGTVFDRPERVFIDGKERWLPRFFEYHLIRIQTNETLSFDAVRDTKEFRQTRTQLSKLSDEWVKT